MRYVAAVLLGLPIGAILLFEMSYLYFGITGKDATTAIGIVICVVSFGFAFVYPLVGTKQTSNVVKRSCNLGMVVAIALPIVTLSVLLLVRRHPDHGDYGMGGLIFYGLPAMAAVFGLVFAILFLIGRNLATRRMNPDIT